VCARGSDQALLCGPSTSPLEGLFVETLKHAPPLRLTSKTLRCRGAREAIRFFDLTHCQCSARKAAVAHRCGSGRISLGSFGERASFGAGAARRRAVRQCQVNRVASFGGDGSPSNHCLERAVRAVVGARSARQMYASRRTRAWCRAAAAQAHR
jgi:hypothetical protein